MGLNEIWNGYELITAISRGESYESIVERIRPGVEKDRWQNWLWMLSGAKVTYVAMNMQDRVQVTNQMVDYANGMVLRGK